MQYPFPFVTFVTAPLEVDSDCETLTAVEPDQRSREQRATTSAAAAAGAAAD